jgi:nitroimidazol reductase NimA-like FMN-containing flavoprotein (pyridoxamine 5'-phosphate oxidase superfamily)
MSDNLRPQRRSRKIAMTPEERDAYLRAERVCRVATVGADGPHATPLWFGWDGTHLWLYSITRSRRWADLLADPRISVVVDSGDDYFELQGVEITGTAAVVGDVPRGGGEDAKLARIEQLFARKYMNADEMFHDGRHAWLRVTPQKITSWDFRKIASQLPSQ